MNTIILLIKINLIGLVIMAFLAFLLWKKYIVPFVLIYHPYLAHNRGWLDIARNIVTSARKNLALKHKFPFLTLALFLIYAVTSAVMLITLPILFLCYAVVHFFSPYL